MAYDRKIEVQIGNAVNGGASGTNTSAYLVTHPVIVRGFSAGINSASAGGAIILYYRPTLGSDTGRVEVTRVTTAGSSEANKVLFRADVNVRITPGNELIVFVPANVVASPMVLLELEDENLDNYPSKAIRKTS